MSSNQVDLFTALVAKIFRLIGAVAYTLNGMVCEAVTINPANQLFTLKTIAGVPGRLAQIFNICTLF